MKILHVSSARAFGGGERHLVDLVRGLAARGHEVWVALRPGSPLGGRLESVPSTRLVELGLRNALDFPSGLKLGSLARDEKIDVIHAHLARDYPPAALAARRAPLSRFVITRHVLFPLNRLHRRALSNVSRVIAVSEAVAGALQAQRIFDPEKIRIVTNAIDLGRFAERPDGRDRGRQRWRVGIVGELTPVKDQEMFLVAAAAVARACGPEVEFVVVGADASPGGPYQARLEIMARESGLSGVVRMLGARPDNEIPGILASLDVCVSASRSESFGIAMAEAMASGVPVVATATEGAREIVEDGVTGTITPIGDPEAMAAAIVSLLRDDERRAAFGKQAAARARERFALDRMAQETERVYLEALGSSRYGGGNSR